MALWIYVASALATVLVFAWITRTFLGMLVEHTHTSQIPESSARAFQTWSRK